MLWSHMNDWPDSLPWPDAVRRHGRLSTFLNSKEGDLTSWRFPMKMQRMELLRFVGPLSAQQQNRMKALEEQIEEIDRVLRWKRNQDWPFR